MALVTVRPTGAFCRYFTAEAVPASPGQIDWWCRLPQFPTSVRAKLKQETRLSDLNQSQSFWIQGSSRLAMTQPAIKWRVSGIAICISGSLRERNPFGYPVASSSNTTNTTTATTTAATAVSLACKKLLIALGLCLSICVD